MACVSISATVAMPSLSCRADPRWQPRPRAMVRSTQCPGGSIVSHCGGATKHLDKGRDDLATPVEDRRSRPFLPQAGIVLCSDGALVDGKLKFMAEPHENFWSKRQHEKT